MYSFNVLKKLKSAKRGLQCIWNRSSMILPEMEQHFFGVHNGKKFVPVFINKSMFYKKLGDFSNTREFPTHPRLIKDKNLTTFIKKKLKK